jgi:methionyl-tRNA synthetase
MTSTTAKARPARRSLLTAALPYANGDLHIGHATEYTMADIHARHRRKLGEVVAFVCGDDQHGSAIQLAASACGLQPEAYIAEVEASHLRDFKLLGVSFDKYLGTHSELNRRLTTGVYAAMAAQGLVDRCMQPQLFDPQVGIFLADRHVKGNCPACKAAGQYGDNCDVCGATYTALELGNPVSAHSGAVPVVRMTEQLQFKLKPVADSLRIWLRDSKAVDEATARKASEWVDGDLRNWSISRPAPYFGFEIPNEPGKFFYVWVDAPIGYLAATEAWCQDHKQDFSAIWRQEHVRAPGDPVWHVTHVIGKDIVNFHTIFWPAMLQVAGFRKPDEVAVHGFLTVNGKKMSKRDGSMLALSAVLAEVPAETLRYFLASKLNGGQSDIDLDFTEFERKVNSDLVGKLVNLAARTAPLLQQHFDNVLAAGTGNGQALLDRVAAAKPQVLQSYEAWDTAAAIRTCMLLADDANRYVEDCAPWRLAKDENQRGTLHEACSVALQAFARIVALLSPVVPQLAERAWQFLRVQEPATWAEADSDLRGHQIGPYFRLLDRVTASALEAARVRSIPQNQEDEPASQTEAQPLLTDHATDQSWHEHDLRVARIVSVQACPGRPEDLMLLLDFGAAATAIAEVAGLARSPVKQADLLGQMLVARVNAAQKVGGVGMKVQACTARGEGAEIFLAHPAAGARPGMRVT